MKIKKKETSALSNLPISKKVVAGLLLSALIGLGTLSGFLVYDYKTKYKDEARERATSLARIIGYNSKAALAFGDKKSAKENLRASGS